jgi:hypothetical protein
VTGHILDIAKKGNKLSLDINFDPHIITLFKEVHNLQWLGFRVPLNISLVSSSAKQVYPFAVSLRETIRYALFLLSALYLHLLLSLFLTIFMLGPIPNHAAR